MDSTDSKTHRRILRAALKIFADRGYAAASVQAIVDAARVTKPTLYYYFRNKAGLYQALIDWAHDERYRLMREASARHRSLDAQLTEILKMLFEFINDNRALMRIAFATAFAAREEIPDEIDYLKKCGRNFRFMHSLIRRGLASGTLNPRFDSQALAMGIYGLMTIHVMQHLVNPRRKLTSTGARSMVRLYLDGAANSKSR